tara:strand:- start:36 stop:188 length:153 start_codon:yes stop_codon:yes gene_type:complete
MNETRAPYNTHNSQTEGIIKPNKKPGSIKNTFSRALNTHQNIFSSLKSFS